MPLIWHHNFYITLSSSLRMITYSFLMMIRMAFSLVFKSMASCSLWSLPWMATMYVEISWVGLLVAACRQCTQPELTLDHPCRACQYIIASVHWILEAFCSLYSLLQN